MLIYIHSIIMPRSCDLTDKTAQFGNNVSHSKRRTRRKFKVNLQPISFYSELLKQNLSLRVATSTIRTIDFKGGIDLFLLGAKPAKLSPKGVKLRKQLMKISEVVADAKA